MKTYVGQDQYVHVFLTSALVGGELLASRLGRFILGERALRYPLDRRLGGRQRWSRRHAEAKILAPTGTRTPTTSVVQPVASRYTD
jgi:hypothetical protein